MRIQNDTLKPLVFASRIIFKSKSNTGIHLNKENQTINHGKHLSPQRTAPAAKADGEKTEKPGLEDVSMSDIRCLISVEPTCLLLIWPCINAWLNLDGGRLVVPCNIPSNDQHWIDDL